LVAGGIAAGIYEAAKDKKPVVQDPKGIVVEHRLFIEKERLHDKRSKSENR
jgi:hypothetical protein